MFHTESAIIDNEKTVLEALQSGRVADLADSNDAKKRDGQNCEIKPVIRASFIEQLCTSSTAMPQISLYGIRIRGVTIQGKIDLSSLQLPFQITLSQSYVPDPIYFRRTSLRLLNLSGSLVGDIHGEGLIVSEDVYLANGFCANGAVNMLGAQIGGDLNCVDGHFDNRRICPPIQKIKQCNDCRKYALHCYSLLLTGARITGNINLCGDFLAECGVNLGDAKVGGNLNCTYGRFTARQPGSEGREKSTGRRLHCDRDMEDHCKCAFNGEGLHICGNLLMNDITVQGETRLTKAFIEKDLDAANGKFNHLEANAIYGDRMHVKGNVFLSNGFVGEGTVRLPRAEINADLSFFGASLSVSDPELRCLYCEGMQVNGTVFLRDLRAEVGYLDLSYSSVGGNLDFTDSLLLNSGDYTIKAKGLNVAGSVFMRADEGRFQANSLVCFTGSKIGMDLICTNGTFKSEKKCQWEDTRHAIKADNMLIDGKVEMDGEAFRAIGGVCLDYSRIGSFLECSGATLTAPPIKDSDQRAFSGGKLNVYGSVYFKDGFSADGEVMLNESYIGRNFVLQKGSIDNPSGNSLLAFQMEVKGSVFLQEFQSIGRVMIDYAVVEGNFYCQNSRLDNSSGTINDHNDIEEDVQKYALSAEGIRIDGCTKFEDFSVAGIISFQHAEIKMRFTWTKLKNRRHTSLYLSAAKVGVLDDTPDSWPEKNKLRINDFEYQYLEDLQPKNLKKRRKEWLSLTKHFRFQPYEHLAAVLQKSGYEEDAKAVHIEKNRRREKQKIHWIPWAKKPQSQSPVARVYKFLHGAVVGYGYKPSRAIWWGLMIVSIGWYMFYIGFEKNLMVEVAKKNGRGNLYQIAQVHAEGTSESPSFFWYSLVYSIDTFLPIIDFQTASYWLPTGFIKAKTPEEPTTKPPAEVKTQPTANDTKGMILCVYRWVHIIFGWIISSFYVVALSHFVRK